MKKIAIFHMLPSGGGIRVLRQFVEGLSSDFDLHIHQPEPASSATDNPSVKKTVYPYPMWKKPSGYLRPVAPVFLMLRLLSFKKVCKNIASNINETADAVLVHNSMAVAAPPILQYLTIPSAYFCYEYPRHIYEKDIIQRTNSRIAQLALLPLEKLESSIDFKSTLHADKIITFSNYMQQRIKDIYGRDSVIVRPGVDTSFFSPAPKPNKQNYVLSVGALWPFKGHETAIKTVSLINSETRPTLAIVADREFPGYREHLVSLAASLSVKLTIKQNISDIQLRELYRDAKAVLCCQQKEPYGLVPLEAMACGTSVISVNQGGFTDNIKHEVNGYLFNGDPVQGAKHLATLLSGQGSSQALITSARHFVESKRTIAIGTKNLKNILESL